MELATPGAELRVCGPDNRAAKKAHPVMLFVATAGGETAEFELTRGECKDLRDALIKALDDTEAAK